MLYTLQKHRAETTQIAWSPNGHILAEASCDSTIRLWDTHTGHLLRTLTGHSGWVRSVAWSPIGVLLASSSAERDIRIWNVQTGDMQHELSGHFKTVNCLAWSPDGRALASGSRDTAIRLWYTEPYMAHENQRTLAGHSSWVKSVAWSPDGRLLASGSDDWVIRLWNAQTGQLHRDLALRGQTSNEINCIAWSPDGRILACGCSDHTIQIWMPNTELQTTILEDNTGSVTGISFSFDGLFLASKSSDGKVRIRRTDTWKTIIDFSDEWSLGSSLCNLAFHPLAPILATVSESDAAIRLWSLDIQALLATNSVIPNHYSNAKVVIVGDSGVGKSGLSLTLTGQPFVATESTHARHVWTFDTQEVALDDGCKEIRETLLWDLAGQPGYRLIHQLHLDDVAVALVVFDGHSETDPFAGVYHWVRALDTAQRIHNRTPLGIIKLLVLARKDRSGRHVSHERVKAVMQELGFDGYFETSAKEGQNITILADAIRDSIEWNMLPKVISTNLFQRIKLFLVEEVQAKRELVTLDELYRAFQKSEEPLVETSSLHIQFDTCVGRAQSKGLIRRLSFGGLVLLQPELLDAYASALINAVKDEPDGLGSILEEKVYTCDFGMSQAERISDREQEKLLLIAMIEDLLRYELVLREQGEDGPYLVFPSESTREHPDLPDAEGKAVVFNFEGPVRNIYATLAVRLAHSGQFTKQDIWKNAITYTASVGGTCGLVLQNRGEGRAELTLFYSKTTDELTRFYFEEYVQNRLLRRALPESIQRRRLFTCINTECGELFPDSIVKRRRERGFNWLRCPICDTRVLLLDREERLTSNFSSLVLEMDCTADMQRDYDASASIIQGKIATGNFDVFLSYNHINKQEVKRIGEQLKKQGILPWIDEQNLRPGQPWQRLLEQQIGQIKSAAVFVGKDGVGPWQLEEMEALLNEFVRRGCPVIPVLLPDAPKGLKLPLFLKTRTWVDFRIEDPDSMNRLIWGITGERMSF